MSKNKHITIIKRPKKHKHAHHGGAWKVAFADFMTAMMAFFMLMWILSISDEDKLEGLAQYFTPATISLSDMGGYDTRIDPERDRNGETDEAILKSDDTAGIEDEDQADRAAINEPDRSSVNPWSMLETDAVDDDTLQSIPGKLDAAMAALGQMFDEGQLLESLAGNVMVSRTDDGIVIEIVDLGNKSMFLSGSSELGSDIKSILSSVVPAISTLPLEVSITGHTDATPFRGSGSYGNWELSIDRASATRRELALLGIAADRFVNVSGSAAVKPLFPETPNDARNRRVTIDLKVPLQ